MSERNHLLNAPKADPGSADLREVLADLMSVRDVGGSNDNLLLVKTRLQLLLFIRSMVFLAVKEDNNDLKPYEWLMLQLYPDHYFGSDIFYEVFRRCRDFITTSTMNALFMDHQHAWAAIFVDEAQVLLNDERGFFLGTKGDKRSSFSGIFEGLLQTRISVSKPSKFPFPIFSGTGMSMQGLEKEKTSGSAKFSCAVPEKSAFINFLPLTRTQVEDYLSTFLQLENVDENVRRHVTSWLRGRPRWAATFVEEYLVRTDKSYKEPTKAEFTGDHAALIQAIDRYIHDMTSKLSDRRKPWQGGNRTACSAFEEFDAENKNRKHRRSLNEIERAIYKYAFGMKPDLLKEDAKILIMTGVAAVHVQETNLHTKSVVAYIDEPLMVEAGVRYYGVDELLLSHLEMQEDGGMSDGYQKLCIRPLQEHLSEKLVALFPDDRFCDFSVPLRSAYGVIAKSCEGQTTEKVKLTMEWLEAAKSAKLEGSVPPFCLPDELFGPDLVCLMWNKTHKEYRVVLCQSKYCMVQSQPKALGTLVPNWLYHRNRGKPDMRLSLTEKELLLKWASLKKMFLNQSIVRVLMEYPVLATKASTPGKGLQKDSSTMAQLRISQHTPALQTDWLYTIHSGNAKFFFSKDALDLLNHRKEIPLQSDNSE